MKVILIGHLVVERGVGSGRHRPNRAECRTRASSRNRRAASLSEPLSATAIKAAIPSSFIVRNLRKFGSAFSTCPGQGRRTRTT